MNASKFYTQFKHAKSRKETNWESLYRDVMRLFCPQRENFYENVPGEKKDRDVYSSAPTMALDKAANNLHASLTPHQKRWVHLKSGRRIPKENKDQAEASLDEIRNTVFDHIFASNFDLAIAEFYRDLLVGTACIHVGGDDKEPLRFTAIPLNELYVATGPNNTVDKVYRCYNVKYGDIESTWPDAVIDDTLRRHIEESPDKEVEIVEGTIPKTIRVYNMETEREEDKEGFGYYVMVNKRKQDFLVERDMRYSPWVVARWNVMAGEEYGRGPAVISYNDAETLNEFVKLHIESMQLAVYPPYTVVDDGIVNIENLRIGPKYMIPVSANDGVFGPSIQALQGSVNFQAGQLEMARLEQSINDQMYTEPLGAVHLPVKSATEVAIRQQELAKRIGSAYGRLQYELIRSLINAVLNQLEMLELINVQNFRVDGHTITIDAVSPLAQAQSQDELNNVMRYTEFALGTFGPQIGMSMIKPEEIVGFVGEQLNIPQKIKMSEADKLKAAEATKAMAMMQGAENVQKAIQPGGAQSPV